MKNIFKVYIIILNYNGWNDTICCLESIFKLNYNSYSVVVCDNCSTDDSENKILEWKDKNLDKPFKYIQVQKNLGYAGGNNQGIKYVLTKGDMDYIWVLNNDTVVDKDALTRLIEKMRSDKKIGMCGSKLVSYYNHSLIQGYGGTLNKWFGISKHIVDKNNISNMFYVIGASMFVSKKFLDQIGLMNEEYFLYYEETDWAIRAKKRFKIDCAIDSIVYHKEGASIGANSWDVNNKSILADYFAIRNRILFMKKYYPCRLPIVYIGVIIAIFNRVRRKQFSRVWMFIKLIFGIKDKKFEN